MTVRLLSLVVLVVPCVLSSRGAEYELSLHGTVKFTHFPKSAGPAVRAFDFSMDMRGPKFLISTREQVRPGKTNEFISGSDGADCYSLERVHGGPNNDIAEFGEVVEGVFPAKGHYVAQHLWIAFAFTPETPVESEKLPLN